MQRKRLQCTDPSKAISDTSPQAKPRPTKSRLKDNDHGSQCNVF